MKDLAPTVSVVIPVWNGETTVGRAIESVRSQKFSGRLEIIVVDDGSTDCTREQLLNYGASVKVIGQGNRGPAAARNTGVRASRGEYIALLDADDAWMAGKLARVARVIEENQDCVLVGSDAVQVNDHDEIVRSSYVPGSQAHPPSMGELLNCRWNLLPSTWMMRRSAFEEAGGFCPDFKPGFIACEDSYFLLRMREVGSFAYVPEPLVRYRMAPSLADRFARRSAELFRMAPDQVVEQIVASHQLFIRLVRERYGRRARRLIESVRNDQANLLAGAAFAALGIGERAMARKIYLNAMRRGPQRCKTAVRLAFALLPDRAARMAAARLSPRMARSLMGPAQV